MVTFAAQRVLPAFRDGNGSESVINVTLLKNQFGLRLGARQ